MKMKKLFILLFTVMFLTISSQAQIIDHTCTDVENIPLGVIETIKSDIKFQWCGQSHSHQLISGVNVTGLELLETEFPNLSYTRGEVELPEPNGTLCIMEGLTWEGSLCTGYSAYVSPKRYWQGDGAHGRINQLFECYPTINVSAMEWCGELYGSDNPACPNISWGVPDTTCLKEYVQAYLDTMMVYEEMYPDVTFIYTTGHSQTDGLRGYARHQCNETIRQHCIDNDRVLYDFGDLDCWYNGEFNYYIYEGDTVPLEHSQYAQDIIYHTTAESCKIKARAAWCMFAAMVQTEDTYTVSGTLTYANDELTLMDDVEVSLFNGTSVIDIITTDEFGEFIFNSIPNGTYTYLATTDKERGGTNIGDMNIVISYINGTPITELQFAASDVNVDGSINVTDLNFLIDEILGISSGWDAPNYVFDSVSFEVNGDNVTHNFQTLCSGDPDGSFMTVIESYNFNKVTANKYNLISRDEVTVYDLAGNVVLRLRNDSNVKQELSTLKRGIYIYRQHGIFTKRYVN